MYFWGKRYFGIRWSEESNVWWFGQLRYVQDKNGLRKGFHGRLWIKGRNKVFWGLGGSLDGARATLCKVMMIRVSGVHK